MIFWPFLSRRLDLFAVMISAHCPPGMSRVVYVRHQRFIPRRGFMQSKSLVRGRGTSVSQSIVHLRRRWLLRAAMPAAAALGAPALFAATDTWNGGGTTNNWSDAANWA